MTMLRLFEFKVFWHIWPKASKSSWQARHIWLLSWNSCFRVSKPRRLALSPQSIQDEVISNNSSTMPAATVCILNGSCITGGDTVIPVKFQQHLWITMFWNHSHPTFSCFSTRPACHIQMHSRAVPDFGCGWNPGPFPNLAEIRLRQKSHRSRIVLPDFKSRFFPDIW